MLCLRSGEADYWGHLNEYGSGTGGGPPGSPLVGQPGYDGDYNTLQTDEASFTYLLNGDPVMRQVANLLCNTSGLYPNGGTNPQATPFSYVTDFTTPGIYGGSGNLWVINKTSGANGGYSTRHNLTDGYRSPWLAIRQLLGYTGIYDVAGHGVAAYRSQCEQQFRSALNYPNYSLAIVGYLETEYAQILMASSGWSFPT